MTADRFLIRMVRSPPFGHENEPRGTASSVRARVACLLPGRTWLMRSQFEVVLLVIQQGSALLMARLRRPARMRGAVRRQADRRRPRSRSRKSRERLRPARLAAPGLDLPETIAQAPARRPQL